MDVDLKSPGGGGVGLGIMNENKSSQESASEKKEESLNDSSAAMEFDNIILQAGKSSVKANDIYCRRFQDWFVR